MISAKIIESFQIKGRGIAVIIDQKTQLPIGRCLQAEIFQNDGSAVKFKTWKEWLLRRSKEPLEGEAFLISDATAKQVQVGMLITIKIEKAKNPNAC
jgi:hypothetical protein